MDILFLVLLSTLLAGKFKKNGSKGAAMYILAMAGTVIGTEATGFLIARATGTYTGLILLMVIGACAVFVIYSAGVKKANSDMSQEPEQMDTDGASENIRAVSIICAIGAFMAEIFGYMLGFSMSPAENWVGSLMKSIAMTFSIRTPQPLLFALAGIGMILISTGNFMLVFTIKGSAKKKTAVSASFTVIYGLFLLFNAACFKDIYLTLKMFGGARGIKMAMAVTNYIPIILAILAAIAVCLTLSGLYRHLNNAFRVLAIVNIVVLRGVNNRP
jgi:F0F1-type ATP synthase assembly protein I